MAATATAPAASSQTKANNQGSVTPVPVNPPRKVTYIFYGVSKGDPKIPYAVAVNGQVLAEHTTKTGRVKCPKGGTGKFSVTVQQGQTVSLYLNSDAHPDFRQHAVYAVTAGERNVEVKVKEKFGKHTDPDVPTRQIDPDPEKEAAKAADTYSAPLTGDIWMTISHKYSETEAVARIPPETSAAVRAAVKSIYRGLTNTAVTVSEPATAGQSAKILQVTFADSNNPKDNISSYTLLSDGLPRVHPAGYVALFTSALTANVSLISLSSCWRPLLGSIAHRAGLGMDVSVLGSTVLNRQELVKKKGDGDDADNVTDTEVSAYKAYQAAIQAEKDAAQRLRVLKKALRAATEAKDEQGIKTAEEELKVASAAAVAATKAKNDARQTWDEERYAGEPAHVKAFRAALLESASIKQLFDPWFMDSNTTDKQAGVANVQKTSNETLHAHHLHITVDDPRIL